MSVRRRGGVGQENSRLTNTTPSVPSKVAARLLLDVACTPPRLRRGMTAREKTASIWRPSRLPLDRVETSLDNFSFTKLWTEPLSETNEMANVVSCGCCLERGMGVRGKGAARPISPHHWIESRAPS